MYHHLVNAFEIHHSSVLLLFQDLLSPVLWKAHVFSFIPFGACLRMERQMHNKRELLLDEVSAVLASMRGPISITFVVGYTLQALMLADICPTHDGVGVHTTLRLMRGHLTLRCMLLMRSDQNCMKPLLIQPLHFYLVSFWAESRVRAVQCSVCCMLQVMPGYRYRRQRWARWLPTLSTALLYLTGRPTHLHADSMHTFA